MTFLQRNELINGLTARGFSPRGGNHEGWNYNHRDGFKVFFTVDGKYTMEYRLHRNPTQQVEGVLKQPADLLNLIDSLAAGI
jgi:hypothetical protein